MLDKLMRLPIIPEGTRYPEIDDEGVLVDSAVAHGQLNNCLTLSEFTEIIIWSVGGTIKIEFTMMQNVTGDMPTDYAREFNIDTSRHGWYRLRVAVIYELPRDDIDIPVEFAHLFERRGPIVHAKAGISGPSIEAIMAYIDSL